MKKGIFAIISLMLLVLLAASVFADDISYSLNDKYQERCNPYEDGDDDEIDDNDDLSYGSVAISAGSGVTILSVDADISGYYHESDMDLDISDGKLEHDDSTYETTIISIDSESKSATVKFIVPQYLDSVNSDGNEVSHQFKITVQYSENNSNSSVPTTETKTIDFKVENNLQISGDIHFESDYNEAKCDVDDEDGVDCDDDDLDNFIPGQRIDMKFVLKNDMADADMDNIDIDIDVDGDEDGFDDGDDDIDLDSKDEKDFSFYIDVDDDADDIDVELVVVGEDEFDAKQGFHYEINNEIEFDSPDYDVDLDVNPVPPYVCIGDETLISFKVTNRGTHDQDNIRVELKDTNLGWSKVDSVSLEGEDDGDYDSHTFNFYMTIPSSAHAGQYNPQLVVYYEDDDSNDATTFQNINLIVKDCKVAEVIEDEDDENIVIAPPVNGGDNPIPEEGNAVPITPGGSDVIVAEPSHFDWQTFWIVSIIVLLIVAIVSLIVFLVKKN